MRWKASVFLFAILAALSQLPFLGYANERINIIYPSISGLVPGLWLTQEAGLFDNHGLTVNLIYIQSASAVMQAMYGARRRHRWRITRRSVLSELRSAS